MKLICDKCEKEIEDFRVTQNWDRDHSKCYLDLDVCCHGEFDTAVFGYIHFFKKDVKKSSTDIGLDLQSRVFSLAYENAVLTSDSRYIQGWKDGQEFTNMLNTQELRDEPTRDKIR